MDTPLIFDYQNGKYGYNTNPNRGADTFHPFSANEVRAIDSPDQTKTQSTCKFIIPANSIGFVYAGFSFTSITRIASWTDNITILVPFSRAQGTGIDFCIFKNDDNQEKEFIVTISSSSGQCYWGNTCKTYVFE